jgi:hypothetical protein
VALSVELLLLAPELAVLDSLAAVLDASVHALTAAHVQLEDSDFAAALEPPSPEVCMADALIAQALALGHLLHNYRTFIAQQPVRARSAHPEPCLTS